MKNLPQVNWPTNLLPKELSDEIVLEPEDCLYGLNKLLASLEEINGMTALDKKGELRSQFYLGTQRKGWRTCL